MSNIQQSVVTFRLATPEDNYLPAFDHTKLSAYNTCPTWGVIRYHKHKRFATHSRAMALEAGSAMHEVFALVRLVTLARQLHDDGKDAEFINEMMDRNAMRMFGDQRWLNIVDDSPQNEDETTRVKHDALNLLETSGFYDDDRDKRRTLTNLQECALAYIDRWDWKPRVWMRDYSDPLSDIGVEISYNLVVELDNVATFRFTGKLDGLRFRNGTLTVEDNKTASRLNDAWEMSFETSHQLTGYCLAAQVFTEQQVRNAEAIGLAIPMPRSEFNGYMRAAVQRSPDQFNRWLQWMLYTVEGYTLYGDTPLEAPMYTHSCNRYFRPCSFIPLCAGDVEERERIYKEFIIDEWNPLDDANTIEGDA